MKQDNLPKPNALWLSRHEATPEQIREIRALGFAPVLLSDGLELGRRSINDETDLKRFLEELRALIALIGIRAIFGVFPTPLLGVMHEGAERAVQNGDWFSSVDIPCYAAWNVNRTPEGGGKPTFEHKQFVLVGRFKARRRVFPAPDGT